MKKIGLGLLSLAIVAVAVLTFWARRETQLAHAAWLQAIASHPSVRLLESRYQPGWARSHATTKFEVRGAVGERVAHWLTEAGAEHAIGRVGLIWTDQMIHGPLALWHGLRGGDPNSVALWIESTIALDNEAQSDATAVLGGPVPPLQVTTRILADGSLESRALLPASSHVLRRADDPLQLLGTLEWQPLHGSLASTRDGWQATVSAEDFQFRREDGGTLTIDGWRLDLQAARGGLRWSARL
jgi:hypothetical protein